MRKIKGISEVIVAVLFIGVAIASFLVFYQISYTLISGSSTVESPKASITDLSVLGNRRSVLVSLVVVGGNSQAILEKVVVSFACQDGRVISSSTFLGVTIEAGKTKEFSVIVDMGTPICQGIPVAATVFRLPGQGYVV
jgi:hypothetical protein